MANYFSLPSFVLYVAVGCMCGLWMKLTYSKRLKADPAAMYFGLWFFLTLFAVLRAVGPNGLGGMDAYGYDLISGISKPTESTEWSRCSNTARC